jgi:hypothetical protein
MAIEFKDGTFSKTRPLPEVIEDFMAAVGDGTAKALHVGTPEEIEEVKAEKQADPMKEIDELKKRIDVLEADKEGPIRVPTREEVNKVIGHQG